MNTNEQQVPRESRMFTGSMDQQSEDRAIAPGDYRRMVNGYNGIVENAGVATNEWGNFLISNPYLTVGENLEIGSSLLSDGSILYAVYNEFGKHGIYQYFRNKPPYVYGVVEKIYQVQNPLVYDNFNENPLGFSKEVDQRITNLVLVNNFAFWCDYLKRPKFIDIERANVTTKRLQFKVCFNKNNLSQTSGYTLKLYQAGNPIAVNSLSWLSGSPTLSGRAHDMQFAYKTSPTAVNFYTIGGCTDFVTMEMVQAGNYYFDLTENSVTPSVVTPLNFYPDFDPALTVSYSPFKIDLIDQLVYAPLCNPDCTYMTDSTRNINLVNQRVFQFRLRYIFFDASKSVLGAISKIPLSRQGATNNYGSTDNFIRVDFTDPRLQSPELCSIIKYVEVLVNEPAIDTTWKVCKQLQQHEIIGLGQQTYDFYNDGNFIAVSEAETIKPFDSLPQLYKSAEHVDNRNFELGTIEGYDPPCVDIATSVDYIPLNLQRYNIKGRIKILNPNFPNPSFIYRQGLYSDYPPENIFGGVRDQLPSYEREPPEDFQQYIPFAGWVVYLAGTDFATVSQQHLTGNPLQNSDGVYHMSSAQEFQDVVTFVTDNPNEIYSEFIIKGVPDGKYILRIASHVPPSILVSPDFIANRAYQKTSTNTRNVIIPNATEYVLTVNGANVDLTLIGDIIIDDLTTAEGDDNTAVQGYLVGNDGGVMTAAGVWADTRIEKAKIGLLYHDNIGGDTPIFVPIYTDHNGYFYVTANFPNVNTPTLTINVCQSGQFTFTTVNQFNTQTGAAWAPVAYGLGNIGVFRCTDANVAAYSRTIIKGRFSGDQLANILIAPTESTPVYTDLSGDFNVIVYVDTVSFIATGVLFRQVTLYFASNDINTALVFSQSSYTPSPIVFIEVIADGITTFNYANPYVIPSPPNPFSNIILYSLTSLSVWKRGSEFNLSVVYGDDGDRRCRVCLPNHISIPFWTELINGQQNFGRAIITISLFHDPPDWATKMWVVVQKNQVEETYLQWAANSVVYVDALFGAATFSTGLYAKINIDNIGYYTTNLYPSSALSYTFAKGDRIRLISTPGQSYYPKYYDYEIQRVEGNDVFIYKDAQIDLSTPGGGVFGEFYTPKNKDLITNYYEFGWCFPIKVGTFNGITKKYHVGTSQDQSFGPSPFNLVTPAIIELTGGDTYIRYRNIPINTNGVLQFYNTLVEDESVSDFYISKAAGYGRIHSDNVSIKRVNLPTQIRFSNPYQQGTEINGLRNYEALNSKQLTSTFGLINKAILVSETVLKVLCENSITVSLYINQNVIKTVINQNLVAISDQEIPNVNQMQRSFGTQHPASVVINDEGDVFYWDQNVGVIVRSSGDGLIAVSEYKMDATFHQKAAALNALAPVKANCPAAYDIYRDLYYITLSPLAKTPGRTATITFALPNYDTEITNDSTFPHIRVYIKPINRLLFDAVVTNDPDFPDINKIIVKGINANPNGFTAALNSDGTITLSSDSLSFSFNYLMAQITIDWDAEAAPITQTFNFDLQESASPQEIADFPGYTASFCKSKNGWDAEHEFDYEGYEKLPDGFVGFLNGNIYVFHPAAPPNEFNGIKHPFKATAVFNIDYNKVKIQKALEININSKEIYCPSITTPPSENVPSGMVTELTKAHFKYNKTKYYAGITRDKNTPGQPDVDHAWVNGRPMQGQILEVNLECDDPNKIKLANIDVIYINEELS